MAQGLAQRLLKWYEAQKRDLPWRANKNPYSIWLSEVILQQTRVQQGMPYFQRFISQYPTVHDLAAAPEEEVLRLWQGLGYYSRARNLHRCAKTVVESYGGFFPDSFQELKKLPGIGAYTAAAIASIAFNEAVAVVDGNVIRVVTRHQGIDDVVQQSAVQKEINRVANSWISSSEPGNFNQALMELGSLVCTPKSPRCGGCPIQSSCQSVVDGKASLRPKKKKPKQVRKRYFNYLLISDADGFYVQQRKDTRDIWSQMYQLPLLESSAELASERVPSEWEGKVSFAFRLRPHKLSHQHIYASIWLGEPSLLEGATCLKVSEKQWEDLPKPKLMLSIFEQLKHFEIKT